MTSREGNPQGRREFDIVVLPSAPASESSPSKPLPEKAIEDLSAPEWRDWDEAVAWFVQLRAAVKSIIYRFVSVLQDAKKVFESDRVTHYSDYLVLTTVPEKLWGDWKAFISQNSMTTDFLLAQTFLVELKSCIKYMKTPKPPAIRSSQSIMENIRTQARFIAIEGDSVWGFIEEAITRLEEHDEGHDIQEQFPQMSQYGDVPDPSTLRGEDETQQSLTVFEETDEEFLERGGFRDPVTLDTELFEPIWVRDEGFPGQMSDDLQEMVGDGRGIQMAGWIRTIFWLSGYKNVVEMIDDPAYRIEDELIRIPIGTSPGDFLLGRYLEENKLPFSVGQKAMGYVGEELVMPQNWAVYAVPRLVPSTVSSCHIRDLYPRARRQCLPEFIKVVSIKHLKNSEKFLKVAHNLFPDDLLSRQGLYFRGLTLFALELTMTFFIPTIGPANRTNDFGPGFYVTNDINYAKDYAGTNGAIMVFGDTDVRDLTTWKPDEEEWRRLIAYNLCDQRNHAAPEKHENVDMIEGPVSRRRPKGPVEPDDSIYQRAFVSYRGCERLASSLIAIIYIQN